MRFRAPFAPRKRYVVGVDEETGSGVVAVTITTTAHYEIYFFRLTDEELASARADAGALDDLAAQLARDRGLRLFSSRLVAP